VGVAKAAPASGGGTDPLVAGVKEIGVVPVAEAAEGEIIDTMPSAYFFCLLKEVLQFQTRTARGRAHLLPVHLLTMCICKCNGPSAPHFKERPFIVSMGSSLVSKALARFFKSGTSAFFLGHNPTKICIRTRLTNSKISWIDI
jgi:hypothetical protein